MVSMDRRETIKYLSAGCLVSVLDPLSVKGIINMAGSRKLKYHVPLVADLIHPFKVPDGSRIPFDWDFFAVGYSTKCAYLKINGIVPKKYDRIKIRLTTAIKIDDERQIEISVPTEEIVLGIMDLKYSPVLQITELDIDKKILPSVVRYGIRLKQLGGEQPVYFFSGVNSKRQILLPHLFFDEERSEEPIKQFIDQLYSINSIQEFGWMEGCVLDGLWQIHTQKKSGAALDAIKTHLRLFFGEDFESGEVKLPERERNYRISSIESTLPFAVIASLYPDHPVIKEAEDFWHSRMKSHGGIVDYSITAEGCYTVAYPMAVFSRVLKKPDFALMSLQQLRIRTKLVDSGNNYLRYYPDKNERTYKNWARGIAWYMLGIIRTISILKDTNETDDLRDEFIRVSNFVLDYQKSNGLWNCFIDDDSTIPDTSGSAGIAAAIATGISEGVLDGYLKNRFLQTWHGINSFLTRDGLLSGVAQSNSGGEKLQRSDYRVISQMGMGLMGQLYACI